MTFGGTAVMAVAKLGAFMLTGSVAMLANAVHSFVDVADGILLYVGLLRSDLLPGPEHPFEYGAELQRWTLIVSLMMRSMGAGVAVVVGINHILRPEEVTEPVWDYALITVVLLFDSVAWSFALKRFRESQANVASWKELDPLTNSTMFGSLLEDSASIVGLVIAFLGIYLSDRWHQHGFDGVASLLIGLLMGGVALGMAYKNKVLLVGEAADDDVEQEIQAILEQDSSIERVRNLLTMHVGPGEILLNLRIQFRGDLDACQVAAAVDRIAHHLQEQEPCLRHVMIEADASPGTNGAG